MSPTSIAPSDSQVSYVAFVAAIGAALIKWQEVEMRLFHLYVSLCKDSRNDPAISVIYNTIVHIDVKLKIIDGLVCLRFPRKSDPLRVLWARCLKAIKTEVSWRNKIAHWQLVFVDGGPILAAPSIDEIRRSMRGQDAIAEGVNTKNLQEISLRFNALENFVASVESAVCKDFSSRSISV